MLSHGVAVTEVQSTIDIYRPACGGDAVSVQAKIDLIWAYIQNNLTKEAEELFSSLSKEEMPAFDYYNIASNLTYFNKEYVKGIDAVENLIIAIDELPDGVSVDYPFYFQGCKLLHEWDERGLRYVYRAMEGNGNYIEDGLKTISFFCRYSGNKEAMRQYEERAQELQRRHEEEDAEIGVLRRTDELSAETLPMSLKESILKEILSIDHGEIKRIFLVRKRITPTRSTSAMVVQLDPNTSEARREEIMQRIFNLLDDSTNWQFSLFDYEAVRPVGVERIEGSVFYEKEKNDEDNSKSDSATDGDGGALAGGLQG